MGWHSAGLSQHQLRWPWPALRQCRGLGRRALWLELHSEGKLWPGRPAPSGLQSSTWSGTGIKAVPCCASQDACRTQLPYLREHIYMLSYQHVAFCSVFLSFLVVITLITDSTAFRSILIQRNAWCTLERNMLTWITLENLILTWLKNMDNYEWWIHVYKLCI